MPKHAFKRLTQVFSRPKGSSPQEQFPNLFIYLYEKLITYSMHTIQLYHVYDDDKLAFARLNNMANGGVSMVLNIFLVGFL